MPRDNLKYKFEAKLGVAFSTAKRGEAQASLSIDGQASPISSDLPGALEALGEFLGTGDSLLRSRYPLHRLVDVVRSGADLKLDAVKMHANWKPLKVVVHATSAKKRHTVVTGTRMAEMAVTATKGDEKSLFELEIRPL